MRTVSIVCRKGGTGKSTVALNLALAAHLRGQKVVLADVDPQHSSHYALSARDRPGPETLATTGGKLFTLKAACRLDGANLLLVDTPSGLDACVLQAMHISDFAVLVTRPNYLDIAAAVMTATALKQLRVPALVVLNQVRPKRGDAEADSLQKAREALRFTGYPVARTALGARIVYAAATANGLSVEEAEPQGPAAAELSELWLEIAEAAGLPTGLESVSYA